MSGGRRIIYLLLILLVVVVLRPGTAWREGKRIWGERDRFLRVIVTVLIIYLIYGVYSLYQNGMLPWFE